MAGIMRPWWLGALLVKGCAVDLVLTMFTEFVDAKLVEGQVECHESYSIGSFDVGDGMDRRKCEAKMRWAKEARVCRSKSSAAEAEAGMDVAGNNDVPQNQFPRETPLEGQVRPPAPA
jgi:hypothetical protein